MIIRNRVKCKKCGDIIESKYRHDFVTCKCGAVSVDGGKDYLRRSGNPEDIEELSEIWGLSERPKRGFRCFGCRKFWGRCFRGLRKRFRGGR